MPTKLLQTSLCLKPRCSPLSTPLKYPRSPERITPVNFLYTQMPAVIANFSAFQNHVSGSVATAGGETPLELSSLPGNTRPRRYRARTERGAAYGITPQLPNLIKLIFLLFWQMKSWNRKTPCGRKPPANPDELSSSPTMTPLLRMKHQVI